MQDNIRTEGAHIEAWRETVIAAIETTRPIGDSWKVPHNQTVEIDVEAELDPADLAAITLVRARLFSRLGVVNDLAARGTAPSHRHCEIG